MLILALSLYCSRGYRLIAESILPLGPGTLIYGSSDGGRTIHADNPEMNARMETAANILNLKGEAIFCFWYLMAACD